MLISIAIIAALLQLSTSLEGKFNSVATLVSDTMK
ncbi:hypothetical protein M1D80_19555 [Phyllobacteriaceae bacterium JZ32]